VPIDDVKMLCLPHVVKQMNLCRNRLSLIIKCIIPVLKHVLLTWSSTITIAILAHAT